MASRESCEGRAGQRHASLLEAIDAVGDRHRLGDILFDDDEADAALLDPRQRGVKVAG